MLARLAHHSKHNKNPKNKKSTAGGGVFVVAHFYQRALALSLQQKKCIGYGRMGKCGGRPLTQYGNAEAMRLLAGGTRRDFRPPGLSSRRRIKRVRFGGASVQCTNTHPHPWAATDVSSCVCEPVRCGRGWRWCQRVSGEGPRGVVFRRRPAAHSNTDRPVYIITQHIEILFSYYPCVGFRFSISLLFCCCCCC